MSHDFLRNLKITVAWLAVLLAGAAAGGWGYQAREADMRAKLLEDARRSTVAIDPAELAHLTGTTADLPTRSYAIVKDRLRQLRAVNPDVRFVYLFRFKPEQQKMVFLADSSEVGAADGSLPGDDYARAAPSPGLQKIIRTGQPVTEGPRTDKFGTWVTAYASFARVPAGLAGPADFLGLDIDAAGWRRVLWQSAFERAFYVWVALGLPLVAWFVARWQMAQRHVIRNLSEAVEQSHSAIVIIGTDGRIEFANRGLIDQVGFNRSELLGRTWRDFHAAETSADVIRDLVATVRSGRPWEGEWFNKRQNGTAYPVHGVVTPVNHSDGSLACFVAVFDDVTVTKQRESELRDARDRAQAGDRAKGQFLATMSHEVRTPLNGIVGFTSLLLETPLTAEQREYVQTIRMSTEALIQLTGDILDFARIESGKLTLDALACDPRECIEDVLDLLAPKADAKRIELLHRVAEDVPAAVDVDAGRLRQVLTNLIGNAIKFTDRGEVSVNLRRVADLQSSPAHSGPAEMCMLEFTVRDTGIGIAPENHQKLFRAFSQVDESTTRRYSGTGLGLAISRNLVELMGGTIGLTSELDQGTTLTFTIRAPVARVLPPMRSLAGLRLGLALRPGPLRNELADLVRGWRGDVVEADDAAQLASAAVDIVLVDVQADAAEALAAQPSPLFGFEPEKIYGLVPMTLASELRTRLRAHFRLLVNKPVHHDAFFALLAGSVGSAPVPRRLTHFGFRVLVVEDNAVNQRLLQRVLVNLGCTPTAVNDGRQALDLLTQRAAEFDVVLLDLHMPEIDGIEALHEIRAGHAGPEAQSLWIIALTADAREEQRARGISEGLNDYLTKPLKPLDLEAAFKKLRTHRLAQER